jgi:hypothetical protein
LDVVLFALAAEASFEVERVLFAFGSAVAAASLVASAVGFGAAPVLAADFAFALAAALALTFAGFATAALASAVAVTLYVGVDDFFFGV